MEYTREEIVSGLREGVCKVVFTKKDGELRTLVGTLNLGLLAESHHPKGTSPIKEKEETTLIKAFDFSVDGWRSFHSDVVTEFVPNFVESFVSDEEGACG